MSNQKIIDRARNLYVTKCRDRDEELSKSIQSTIENLNSRKILNSSIASNDISRLLSNEYKERADLSWDSIFRSLKVGDIEQLDDLNNDLKTELSFHLEQEKKRLSDDIKIRLNNIKLAKYMEEIESSLGKIRNLSISKYGAEIDLYVDRLRTAEPKTALKKDRANQIEVQPMPDTKKVFVVHGRNARLRDDFFAFLRALTLQPIEWSEALSLTGKATPYIGDVLEKAFEKAQAVIVLLSPDDEVRLSPDLWKTEEDESEKNIRLQARPNVLFEAGMAFGTDDKRTLLIEIGPVKPFSDVAGRHVVRLSNSADKRNEIAERLKTAGCDVSTIGKDWLTTGDFEVKRGNTKPGIEESQDEPVEKLVDLEYPADSGLKSELESKGFEVKWCSENRISRCIDIEGWELVTQTSKYGKKEMLKVKDRPHNQILVKKRL